MRNNNPYQTPRYPPPHFDGDPRWSHQRHQPRRYRGIGRLIYFGLNVVNSFGSSFIISPLLTPDIDTNTLCIVGIVAILSNVVFVYLTVMRLRNLGYRSTMAFGLLIPLLNLWMLFQCFALPEGYAHHNTLDIAARILVGISVVLIAVFLFLVVALLVV